MSYQPYVDPVGMDPRHYGFVTPLSEPLVSTPSSTASPPLPSIGGLFCLTPFLVVFCISWQLSWLLGLRQAAVTRRLPEFRAESCC